MITQAMWFAAGAHFAVSQTRKYTGEPYIAHPLSVAKLVRDAGGDDAMCAAAFLHDVVEDTGVTIDVIRGMFGDDIGDLVYWLTDVSRPEDGNRAACKAIDRNHLSQASARAKVIKLADIIDNTSTIVRYDPAFARVYLEEMRALLEVLKNDHPASLILYPMAQKAVATKENTL